MQINVERPAPCQAKVSFTVPSTEFEAEFQKALKELGKRMKIKGFRPGHVPADVVARLQGKELRQEVAMRFVNQAYSRAIDENKLRPLNNPQVDFGEVLAGVDFAHSFEFPLRPEFQLAEYKGLELESSLPPILDEEIEAAIDQARKNQAHPEPIGDDGLPEDGMALCKVTLLHEGAQVWERDGLRISPSTTLPGVDGATFKAAMTGKKDGDTVECPITFPEDFEAADARGKAGVARVEIKNAFKIIQPSREELMKIIGAADEAELLRRAKEGLEQANTQLENQRVETELLERLIAAHTMDLPPAMIDEQAKGRLAQMRAELEQSGKRGDELEQELSAREQSARADATKASKAYFLIERIAEAEKIQVAEQELVGELRSIARRNRSSFEEVRDFYQQQNLLGQLAMEILERKIRAFLRENAKLVAPKA
ncbi:MAG: trigger factor [Planctomycetaceae bacterium]|nr:trigger factor [Planctomycetaceae bacterium]